MSRRIGRWIAVLLASAVALMAPVPVLTPAAEAADTTNPVIPASYLNQTIRWTACAGDLASRCANVSVPLDWKSPTKGNISLAIAYLKASGAGRGLLTTNPGGPGAAGRTFTEALSWSKTKLQQYDLLGFDPRGYGASTNVKCLTTTAKYNRLPKVADRRSRTKATHAVEVAEAKLFAEACSSDPRARYINTQQTVWDLDFLRQLLAKNQARSYPVLNYIGYSYGTWLGAWYADSYPKNVGRFILDSNMQWTSSMYTNQALDSVSFQRRRDKMLFPYLARHNADFGLGKSAKSVKKKYESTRKKLAKQAKKAVKKGRTPSFGPEDLDYTVAQYIYTDAGFDFAGAIVDAAGDVVRKPSSTKYRKTLAKRVKPVMTKAPFSVQRSAKSVSGSAMKDI
ncbi:MAG TPA: alpha/beta fold hydrolase, partial [Microlunatus sp.]|nr:alpha/beta fold hydrolase [Microlunatus sp.]